MEVGGDAGLGLKLNADEKYRGIPVVLFTGLVQQKDIDDAYESGAHYYVVKPYALTNYAATLERTKK